MLPTGDSVNRLGLGATGLDDHLLGCSPKQDKLNTIYAPLLNGYSLFTLWPGPTLMLFHKSSSSDKSLPGYRTITSESSTKKTFSDDGTFSICTAQYGATSYM